MISDPELREFIDQRSIPEPNSGCSLWDRSCNRQGYGSLTWRGRHYRAHRASWIATHGPINDGLYACHKCDVRSCVNPAHLFLGTQKENVRDMMAKGRGTRIGTGYHKAKLSDDEIRAIRADPRLHRIIAKEHSIHRTAVGQIKNGIIRRKTP